MWSFSVDTLHELEVHQPDLGLEPGALERLHVVECLVGDALEAELSTARPDVERVRIERDPPGTDRLHGEPDTLVITRGIAHGHRLDVIVVGILAAEVETEEIPHLHEPVVRTDAFRVQRRTRSEEHTSELQSPMYL